MPLTNDQFDAVCDAQDTRTALATMPTNEVAAMLKGEGVPLFADYTPEGEEPAEVPAKATALAKAATVTGGAAYAEAQGIPQLDTGPAAVDVVERGEVAVIERSGVTVAAVPAPKNHALVAAQADADAIEGLEELDHTDMIIPTIRLKQDQTKDENNEGIRDVENGNFFLSNCPTNNAPQRELVFLHIAKGKAFFLPYKEEERDRKLSELGLAEKVAGDTSVVCSSSDRLVPTKRDDRPWGVFSETCGTCPHGKWKTGSKGRIPPACGDNYRALVADLSDDGALIPARMTLRSTGVRPMQSNITNLTVAAKQHGARGTYAFTVEVTSRKVERPAPKGNYYAPHFGRPLPIADATLVDGLRAMRENLRGTD